jgi:hypothetical protein
MNRKFDLQRLYAPSVSNMCASLPDVGASLDTACCELARDCTVERVEQLAMLLQAAMQNLGHLRKALIAERGTG